MDERAVSIIEKLAKEYDAAKYYLNYSNNTELLVAVILSAQCRDEAVNRCTKELFRKYRSAKDFSKLDEKDIASITFFRNKAKSIREACRTIEEKYGGKVPSGMDDLLEISGIGRKSANVIQQNGFGIVFGIIVDMHAIRLSQRMGLTKNKNPEKIEKDLMGKIPKKYWKKAPHLMKGHGRRVCTALKPNYGACVLKDMCPSAFKIK